MRKRYSVIYLPHAERDLEEIFDYIRRDAPFRAGQFLKQFDKKVSRLARFPLSGLVPRDPFLLRKGYRILVLDPYLAFYRVEKGSVVICRVLHGKRKYEFLLK